MRRQPKGVEMQKDMVMDYEEAVSSVERFRYSKDLENLEKTVEDLEQKVNRRGNDDYVRFMLYVCDMLSSHDFGDYQRQDKILHRYVDLVLTSTPSLPLEIELRLLVHLEDDFGNVEVIQSWDSPFAKR